jgi:hypothetical protein
MTHIYLCVEKSIGEHDKSFPQKLLVIHSFSVVIHNFEVKRPLLAGVAAMVGAVYVGYERSMGARKPSRKPCI